MSDTKDPHTPLTSIPDSLIFARHRPAMIRKLHAWCESCGIRPTFADLEAERQRRRTRGIENRETTDPMRTA